MGPERFGRGTLLGAVLLLVLCGGSPAVAAEAADSSKDEAACAAMAEARNLTIISASLRTLQGSETKYCYVRGLIPPGIHYHVQLPLPQNWNGRFVNWGDGGKDGGLNFADARVAQGYASANSNMGHDSGSEPGSSFGYNNRQSEIDFAYRAVHLTVNAAKTLIEAYYGKPA
jgi:feruloyl esterase